MPVIRILLLEDDSKEATKFTDRYSTDLIIVDVAKNVFQFFSFLESSRYDLVIIDPVMARPLDPSPNKILDFPRLLEEVQKKNIELVIAHPGEYFPDKFKEVAQKKEVDIVSFSDQKQLMGLLTQLLEKKSTSSTQIKDDQRKLEIRLVRLEVTQEEILKAQQIKTEAINKLRDCVDDHGDKLIELGNNQLYMKDTLNNVHDTLKCVAKEVDEIHGKDPRLDIYLREQEERSKAAIQRMIVVGSICTALIAAGATIIVAIAPTVIQHLEGKQDQQPKKVLTKP